MGTHLFDQYTYLHFAVGIIMYFWGLSFELMLALHTLFEILENTSMGMAFINQHITVWPGGKPYADSFINSVGDTVGAVVGWYSAKLLDIVGARRGWYEPHSV